MRPWLLSLLPALLALAAACHTVPPLRAGGATGARIGDVSTRPGSSIVAAAAVGEVHVGFTMKPPHPGTPRRSDLSLGWLIDWPLAGTHFAHGPYVESIWFPARRSISHDTHARFGPLLRGELLVGRGRTTRGSGASIGGGGGAGIAAGLLLELVQVMPDGPDGRHADVGLGLAVRAGARTSGGQRQTYVLLSLEFNLPRPGEPPRPD